MTQASGGIVLDARPGMAVRQHLPGQILLVVVLVELFLGGSGRLFELGELSVRMYLYGICMGYLALRLSIDPGMPLPRLLWVHVALFFALLCFGGVIGLSRGVEWAGVLADAKPLLYFPMVLFFASTLRHEEHITLVSRLLVFCGVIQALAYIATLAATHGGLVSYADVYSMLGSRGELGEFYFRGDDRFFLGFFFKGFLFMCVSLVFLVAGPRTRNLWLAAIVLMAVLLTFTRGFLVALFATALVGLLINSAHRGALSAAMGALVVLATLAIALVGIPDAFQRSVSDDIRIGDLRFFTDSFDIDALLIGKGLGAMIGERFHIENTYIEVLYKQGIAGLAFWLFLLYGNVAIYRSIVASRRPQALPFLLAAVFVFFQTATNPFLTNSIGMSMLLLSTVCLLVLKEEPPRPPEAQAHGE